MNEEKIEKNQEVIDLKNETENITPDSGEKEGVLLREKAVENELDILSGLTEVDKEETVDIYKALSPDQAKATLLNEVPDDLYAEIEDSIIKKEWSSVKNWMLDKGLQLLPKNKLSRVLASTLLLNMGANAVAQSYETPQLATKASSTVETIKKESAGQYCDNLQKNFPNFFKDGSLGNGELAKKMTQRNVIRLEASDGQRGMLMKLDDGSWSVFIGSEKNYLLREDGTIKFRSYEGKSGEHEKADQYLSEVAKNCNELKDVSQYLRNYMYYDHDKSVKITKQEAEKDKRTISERLDDLKNGRLPGVCDDYALMAKTLVERSEELKQKYNCEVAVIVSKPDSHAFLMAMNKSNKEKDFEFASLGINDFEIVKGDNEEIAIQKLLEKYKIINIGTEIDFDDLNIDKLGILIDAEKDDLFEAVNYKTYKGNNKEDLVRSKQIFEDKEMSSQGKKEAMLELHKKSGKYNFLVNASKFEDDPAEVIKMLEKYCQENPQDNVAVSRLVWAYSLADKDRETLELLKNNMMSGKANKSNLRKLKKYSVFLEEEQQKEIKDRIKDLYPGSL